MNKNISIKLENQQKIIDAEEKENFSSSFQGELYQKNDKLYLSYNDHSEGIDGAQTIVKIDSEKERVLLLRHQPAAMKQDFIAGEKMAGYFNTCYGEIEISVKTEAVEIEADLESGLIKISYQVFLGGELNAEHRLKLSYKTLK